MDERMSNTLDRRHQEERHFHDDVYRRALDRLPPSRLKDAAHHDPWSDPNLRPILSRLPKDSGTLLELGCGPGIAALAMARAGHSVNYTDISVEAVRLCRARLMANLEHRCGAGSVCAAESLPFDIGSFDVVYGIGVLHHLSLSVAGAQVYRVLKPGGLGVFVEPLGENRLLNAVRYAWTDHTPEERMLRYEDIDQFTRCFDESSVEEFQLAGILRLARLPHPIVRMLDRLDDWLLRAAPFLRRYCRLVAITVRRKSG